MELADIYVYYPLTSQITSVLSYNATNNSIPNILWILSIYTHIYIYIFKVVFK